MNGGKGATSSTSAKRARSCFCCGNSDDPIVDFPTGKHNRIKWVRCMQHRYKVKNIRSGDGICVKHFRSDHWKLNKNNQVTLVKNGLPKFFNHPLYKNCKKPKNQLKGKNYPSDTTESQNEASLVSDVKINSVEANNSETIQIQLDDTKTNAEQVNNTSLVNDNTEENSEYVSDKEKIDLVMQNRFSFVKGQVPQKLTPEQTAIVQDLVANPDNLSKATRRTMLHCTVCSVHIGTSVIAQFDRFVHPILNTLMCESCYIFYTTGVFTKDDDGSELYCKWCAQGGTVMCCAKCPLVFCQECVIRNLGMEALDSIDSNDDWECFRCKPSQISIIQIMTAALHEYTLKKIAYALSASDDEILQEDISQCCDKPKLKRRNEDAEYTPAAKKIKLKINVKSNESNKKSNNKNQTTTVLLNKAIQPQPPPLQKPEPPALTQQVNTNATNTTPAPPMIKIRADLLKDPKAEPHDDPPLLSPEPTTPFFRKSLAVMPTGLPLVDSMPKMREQLSAKMGVNLLSGSPPPLVLSSPPPLIPTTLPNNIAGNKEDDEALAWLRTAMDNSKVGVQSLLMRYDKISLDSDKCKRNPGELAELHNKMQHVMSQCTNLLIETRKNMHREFLAFLHKKNVSHSSSVKHPDKLNVAANGAGIGVVKTLATQPVLMKAAPNSIIRLNPPKKVVPSIPAVATPANPVAVRPVSMINTTIQGLKPATPPKIAPQGMKIIPQGLKALPQGLKPLPQGLKPLPQGLKPLPQGLKPLPQGLKAIPQGIKAVPLSSFPGIRLQKGAFMIATTAPKSKITTNVKTANAIPIAPAPLKTSSSPANKVIINPALKSKLVLSNPVSLAKKPTAIRTPANTNTEKDPLAMSDDEDENSALAAQEPPVLLNSGHVQNTLPEEDPVRIKIEVEDT